MTKMNSSRMSRLMRMTQQYYVPDPADRARYDRSLSAHASGHILYLSSGPRLGDVQRDRVTSFRIAVAELANSLHRLSE